MSDQPQLSPAKENEPQLNTADPEALKVALEFRDQQAKLARAEQRAANLKMETMLQKLLNASKVTEEAEAGEGGSGGGGSKPGRKEKVENASVSGKANPGGKKGGKTSKKTRVSSEVLDTDEEDEVEEETGMDADGAFVRRKITTTNKHNFTARIQTDVPVLAKGMTMKAFKTKVELWEKMVKNSIRPAERAAVLISKLPTEDEHGGIQSIIIMNHGIDAFDTNDGVKRLLVEIENIAGGSSFVKLNAWIEKFFSFNQKSDWSMSRLITEYNKLFQTGYRSSLRRRAWPTTRERSDQRRSPRSPPPLTGSTHRWINRWRVYLETMPTPGTLALRAKTSLASLSFSQQESKRMPWGFQSRALALLRGLGRNLNMKTSCC